MKSSAIVLDVKPEIWQATHYWRGVNSGPVFRFQPSASDSCRFNPLDIVPSDRVEAYTAITRLVPLLLTPTDASSAKSFWEGRAAQLLQAALYDVCLHPDRQPSGRRDMTAVLDWFTPSAAGLASTIKALKESGIRQLIRVGNTLETQDPETQSNLFDTVLRHIEIWGSPQVEDLISSTTFDISILRRSNGTLYLCVTPEELVTYRPLIRSMLGSILYFIRDCKSEWTLPPVTVFLDEFPQLGYMQEIEQMLALGRQAGLRLWLFAQTKGQISATYGDAGRILEMMAVRAYISPTGELAHELSRELGSIRDPFTGAERPLATAQQLMGPEYANKVVVLEGGRRPARLDLIMAYNDPNLQFLLGEQGILALLSKRERRIADKKI